MFIRPLLAAVLSVAALATNANATAITIFNTGACAGNNAGGTCSGALLVTSPSQFDNNYRLIARGDGGVTGNNSTQTEPPIGGSPGYVAQNTTSDWITPVPGGNLPGAPTTYTYQTAFSLAGFTPNTLVLSLSVAAENLVSVRVNGGSTNVFTPACNSGPPAAQPFCFQQFFSTTINNAAVLAANGAGWNAGTNTLEFIVTNNDNPSPTGLRVEVSGDATLQAVSAPITIFNTGACAGNNAGGTCSGALLVTSPSQFDNNYRLIARGDGGVTGNNSTQTEPPIGGSPGYVAQNTTSDWITPVPGGNLPGAPTTYTYQTSFSLAGFTPNTLVLSLSVAAENLVSVRVNGGSTNVFTPACNSGPPAAQPFCFQQFFSTTINNAAVLAANGAGWNAGTNTLEFIVTNNDNPSPTGLRVEVSGAALTGACPTITVNPSSLPSGTAGTAYGPVNFTATGASSPTFSLSSGTLPAGLTLSPAGVLSGTPTQTGSFPITVLATDSNGCTGTRSYTLVINCPTITVNPATLPPALPGIPYGPVTFTQSGGIGAATFAITGSLPAGMMFGGATLSGTPAQNALGTFNFTITATDSNGCTGSRAYTLVLVCPEHRIHGHLDTAVPTHSGQFHQHHGVHGHTITFGCIVPPHAPGHSAAGLSADPEDFAAVVNDDWVRAPIVRGTVAHLFGSAAGFYLGEDHDAPAINFTPSATGLPLYHTTSLPEVRIGGLSAKVLFSGLAPGLNAVWQVSIIVPEEAPAGRLPVSISYENQELRSVDLEVK